MSTTTSCCTDQDFLESCADDQYEILFHHTHKGFQIRKETLSKLRKGKRERNDGNDYSTRCPLSRPHGRFTDPNEEIQSLEAEIQDLKRSYVATKRRAVTRQRELDTMQSRLNLLKQEMANVQRADPYASRSNQYNTRAQQINYEKDQSVQKTYEEILKTLQEERAEVNEELALIGRTIKSKENRLEELCMSMDNTFVAGGDLVEQQTMGGMWRNEDVSELLSSPFRRMGACKKTDPFPKERISSLRRQRTMTNCKDGKAASKAHDPISEKADEEPPFCSLSGLFEGLVAYFTSSNAFVLSKAAKRGFSIQAQYDANETFRNLLHWTGTVIQFIFWKPITWICIFMHYFGFFWTRRLRAECSAEFLPSQCWYDRWASQYGVVFADIPVFMTLAAFLFVSYNNMCLRIFERQYFTCEMITGRITSLAMHTRSVLDDPARRWSLQRFIVVAQCIYYWNHRRAAAESHQFLPGSDEHPGTWEEMSTRYFIPEHLLTEAECEYVGRYRGNRCILMFSWYERTLRRLRAGDARWDESILVGESDRRKFVEVMMNHVLEIKALFASTSMVAQFAVPFSYYHLTYLVLVFNLVLLAYCFLFINGLKGNPASLIIYPAVVIMLSGLHELANKMSDPFGDDESDLNIDAFLNTAVQESRNLCFSPDPDDEPGDTFLELGEDAGRQWHERAAEAAAAPQPVDMPEDVLQDDVQLVTEI